MPLTPDTHYAATRWDNRQRTTLEGAHEVETCVVGGGLAGVATALALAERGRSVILLEGNSIGWGASGRNGGFVSAGYPVSIPELATKYGEGHARVLWDLSRDALALVRRRAEKMGVAVLNGTGALRCRMAGYPDTLQNYVTAMNSQFDAGLVYLPEDVLSGMLATERYADGFLNPSSLQVHPLNLALGMAREAEVRGAVLHENSRVVSIITNGTERVAYTATGRVKARHMVLAGGAHLGLLHKRLGLATVPVASFVMTTEPATERLADAIRTDAAVSDTRVATDYYRKLPDGRLLWGGRANAWQPEARRLKTLLRSDMARIYPQLADLRIERAWHGLMPIARHCMPVIGPLGVGLWAAACFGGLGLANTTLAGELIAAAIAENDDRYRYFEPFGLPFAGGPLGRAAFQIIYTRYRIADRLVERRHRVSLKETRAS